MLYRKIQPFIEGYLKSDSNKVLIIDGARQIGKTFIKKAYVLSDARDITTKGKITYPYIYFAGDSVSRI